MTRRQTVFFFAAIVLASPLALSQTTRPNRPVARISLQYAETSEDSAAPYRRANLTVHYDPPDDSRDVIRAVTVRSARGGPVVLLNATIPPHASEREFSVLLPAMSAQDSCNVRLLSGATADSPAIAKFETPVNWPAESVTAEAFLDPDAHDQGDFLPPVWSDRTLQLVFVIAASACAALGACLLIRRPAFRTAAASAVLIAAACCLWLTVGAKPIVIRKEIGPNKRLLLISCLRDTRCEVLPPHTVPLYYDMDEMSQDRAVVAAPGKLIVDLEVGRVRLFARPAQPDRPATQDGGEASGL